jgi:excisionase family DNA binding protein
MDRPLLTVAELAEFLATTPQSVRHMIHRRQIPFVRLGARRIRFDQNEIAAWLDAKRVDVA